MNIPHRWVIVKIDDSLYKVLGGWYGGYLDGDYWRLSSGITKVEKDGVYYIFHNQSGSIYKCHEEGEGTTGLTASILSRMNDKDEAVVAVPVGMFLKDTNMEEKK